MDQAVELAAKVLLACTNIRESLENALVAGNPTAAEAYIVQAQQQVDVIIQAAQDAV